MSEDHLDQTGMLRLLAIMAQLRDPDGGCPWDLNQSFRTILPYTLEEAYEVADAIERFMKSFDALVTFGALHVSPRLGVEPEMTGAGSRTHKTTLNDSVFNGDRMVY